MARHRAGSKPKYQLIVDALRAEIDDGTYQVGAQLPTKPEMMQKYAAALGTVDHALKVLRDAGLVVSYQGVGTFVRTAPAEPEPAGGNGHLAAEVAELTEALGRIEGNLIELYGKTGNDYPWEDLPDGARPAGEKGGSHEQRA